MSLDIGIGLTLKSIGGGAGSALFSLIRSGVSTVFSIYTRVGDGYGLDTEGDPATVAEDIPMNALNTPPRLYLSYAGTNVIPDTGIVNQPVLTISSTEEDPFRSPIGTLYGIEGLFAGVDGENAIGRVVLKRFSTASIAADIDILTADGGERLLWIEATTGLIKSSDGTTTLESDDAIAIDTEYKIELVWYTNAFWIIIDDVVQQPILFTGAFPALGGLISAFETTTYITIRELSFSNNVNDIILRDELDVPLTDELDNILTIEE